MMQEIHAAPREHHDAAYHSCEAEERPADRATDMDVVNGVWESA